MRIKICGISDPELARMTLKAGADLVGIVLTPTSKRYVPVEKAVFIVEAIREEYSNPVLVFRNESFEVITSVVEKLGDCIVQIQGEHISLGLQDTNFGLKSERYISDLKKIISTFDTIVAFPAENFTKNSPELNEIFTKPEGLKKPLLLVDGQQPGSGKNFSWDTFKSPNFSWILAGGLNSENIKQAINQLNPNGVDVSTGVEDTQGKKSLHKIEAFIEVVKESIQ